MDARFVITCLALLLFVAVVTDVRSRRIPNALVARGIAVAVAAHAVFLLMGSLPLAGSAWWAPLVGLLAGGGASLPLYLLRACGAGDVKLLAMVGAFVGPATALEAVLYTLLAGGLLALLFMLRPGVGRQAARNLQFLLTSVAQRAAVGQGPRLEPLAHTAARLPYAVAISLGTAASLLWPLGGR